MKTVILYYQKENSILVTDINLPDDVARMEVIRLREEENLPAYYFEQEKPFRNDKDALKKITEFINKNNLKL